MRKCRFSKEQKIGILQEHAGGEVARTLCRRHGSCQQTLFRWRAKYDGADGNELRRLEALKEEYARSSAASPSRRSITRR